MSERENFLGRWSRLKREAEESRAPDASQTPDDQPRETDAVAPQPEDASANSGSAGDTGESESAFDLSKLPPIESITATTDIRPFLAAGVPDNVKYAALRRVWVADPHIRDFVGIAENQWDFTAPDGLHGFGPLLPSDDVAQLVANVFADRSQPEQESSATVTSNDPEIPGNPPDLVVGHSELVDLDEVERALAQRENVAAASPEGSTSEEAFITQRNKEDIASQNSSDLSEPREALGKRSHGSALPE